MRLFFIVFVLLLTFSIEGYAKKDFGYASYTGSSNLSLRDLAQQRGIKIGAAMDDFMINENPEYAELARREFNSLTSENHMKWEHIHPKKDKYDFKRADAIVDFARSNQMVVRGHTLVHADGQLPKWLKKGDFSGEELAVIMQDHIRTVVGHYKKNFPDVVVAWDVVNESFADDAGTWRTHDMIWSKIGSDKEDYLRIAFKAARAADPSVKLFYNDNGIETINPKSDAVYRLIKSLKEEGVPIDGIGFQTHILNTKDYGPALDMDLSRVEENFRRFADLGLEINITEMDVPVKITDGITEHELMQQARIYKIMMQNCLKFEACTMFTIWGFTDKFSWWNGLAFWWTGFKPLLGAALPFDKNYKEKPAYFALRDAMK